MVFSDGFCDKYDIGVYIWIFVWGFSEWVRCNVEK